VERKWVRRSLAACLVFGFAYSGFPVCTKPHRSLIGSPSAASGTTTDVAVARLGDRKRPGIDKSAKDTLPLVQNTPPG